jgi:hypothetical protein
LSYKIKKRNIETSVFRNANNTTVKRTENVTRIKTRDRIKVNIARIIEIISDRKKLLHIANAVTAMINNIRGIILLVLLKNKNFL